MAKNIFQQTWWQSNLDKKMDEFKGWIGDFNSESKVLCRKYVAHNGFKTLLDAGCGVCTEFFGYKSDGYDIDYMGMDATPKLVELGKSNGINVVHGYLEEMPLPDNSREVVFIRHILEHLPDYKEAISEAIRVASKEVIVVFFLKPSQAPDKIDYDPNENLYHNVYNGPSLDAFVKANPKVADVRWVDVNHQENIMIVEIKGE